MVAQAPVEARAAKAQEVIRAAGALSRPSALPFVVGAVAQTTPEAAPALVAEVVQSQPSASLGCVHAATIAAPSQTAAIVSTAVRAQPTAYASIAVTAAQAAPTRSADILGGVTASLPQLQPFIARASGQGAQADVTAVMPQVQQMVASAAQAEVGRSQSVGVGAAVAPAQAVYQPLVAGTQKGPPVVTPLTPALTYPPEKGVGDSTVQSGNDRDYSAP